MHGRIVHNQDHFLVKIFAKIIDASDNDITINGTKTTIGLSCIVSAQKSEHISALTWSTFYDNCLSFFLPSVREIGCETQAGFIKIIEGKYSL